MTKSVVACIIVLLVLVSCKDNSEQDRLRAMELELKEKDLKIQERLLEFSKAQRIRAEGSRTLSQLYEQCEKSVFLVFALDDDDEVESFGSGFILRSDGVGVTNYHVLEGTDNVRVYFNDSRIYRMADILSADADKDYVVFRMQCEDHEVFHPAKLAESLPKIGEICFAIGNPEGFTKTLSEGIISGYRGSWIQNTAQTTHGSSGGALFNNRGEVIGITTKGIEGADLNFALNIVDNAYFRRMHSPQEEYSVAKRGSNVVIAYSDREIIDRLQGYFTALQKHDYYALRGLYADKLERFYKRNDVSKDEAIREHERYVKTYPHPKTVFEKESVAIKRADNGITAVTLEIDNTIYRESWSSPRAYRFQLYVEFNPAFEISSVYSRLLE